METLVILVLCTYLQDQIPNPFRMASGHDLFLFRDGCALTLRKLAAKPGNVQPGSAFTHLLILRIGSQRLPCNCERVHVHPDEFRAALSLREAIWRVTEADPEK